jgi:mRNA-degrading endonuclease RelE of RelBE toxin-antitoxin system
MYQVILTKKAEKAYNELDEYRDKINKVLDYFKLTPYPAKEFDLVKLGKDAYRIRIGRVRIKYYIEKADRKIYVYDIGLRKDSTYKK